MPPTFAQCPYALCRRQEFWREFWRDAKYGTKRFGLLGDSRDTAPGGFGAAYIPYLNAQFFARYRNSPETILFPVISSGGGSPAAPWLGRTTFNGGTFDTVTHDKLPPGWTGGRFASGDNGALWMLQPDAHDIPKTSSLIGGLYWDRTAVLYADIFAVTRDGGDPDVGWRATPQASFSSNFFQPVTSSGTTAGMGLNSAAHDCKVARVGPLSWNSLAYQQLLVRGSSTQGVDLVGARFVNGSNPSGVTVTPLAAGGYSVSSYLANHANSGEVLRAFGFDAFMLRYAANDAYSGAGITATQYKTNVLLLMAQIRTWYGNASLPFILLGSPRVVDPAAPGSENTAHDEMAGALLEVAQSDDYAMFVNTRRLTEEAGYTAATEDLTGLVNEGEWSGAAVAYLVNDRVKVAGPLPTYWKCITAHTSSGTNGPGTGAGAVNWHRVRTHLADDVDTVHWSDFAAKKIAALEVAAMMGVPGRPRITPWVGPLPWPASSSAYW